MDTPTDAWGIVLAGGLSRRLGRDKAMEPLGGEPLLHGVIRRLSEVTAGTVVVVNNVARADELALGGDARVAVDIYPDSGSLGGIFTGLTAMEADWGVVVACDMPFLNVELFRHLLASRDGFDVAVPELDGRPEPTHAVYSKACLTYIEPYLKAGDLKIARFFDDVRVNYVLQPEVERLDPELLSFFNVNTQRDLDRAMALVAERESRPGEPQKASKIG